MSDLPLPSQWDEGFKAGFEMAVQMGDKRMGRIEDAVMRMIGWIAQSSNGCLTALEAREIAAIIHPPRPKL